jgi:hypothetical protein
VAAPAATAASSVEDARRRFARPVRGSVEACRAQLGPRLGVAQGELDELGQLGEPAAVLLGPRPGRRPGDADGAPDLAGQPDRHEDRRAQPGRREASAGPVADHHGLAGRPDALHLAAAEDSTSPPGRGTTASVLASRRGRCSGGVDVAQDPGAVGVHEAGGLPAREPVDGVGRRLGGHRGGDPPQDALHLPVGGGAPLRVLERLDVGEDRREAAADRCRAHGEPRVERRGAQGELARLPSSIAWRTCASGMRSTSAGTPPTATGRRCAPRAGAAAPRPGRSRARS